MQLKSGSFYWKSTFLICCCWVVTHFTKKNLAASCSLHGQSTKILKHHSSFRSIKVHRSAKRHRQMRCTALARYSRARSRKLMASHNFISSAIMFISKRATTKQTALSYNGKWQPREYNWWEIASYLTSLLSVWYFAYPFNQSFWAEWRYHYCFIDFIVHWNCVQCTPIVWTYQTNYRGGHPNFEPPYVVKTIAKQLLQVCKGRLPLICA